MKRPLTLLLPAALVLGFLAVRAQEAPKADPFVKAAGNASLTSELIRQNCVLVMEAYALDKDDAWSVLSTERGSPARYRRVLELAKSGQARLETLTALSSKSGQRAVTESTDEVRYPTEFNPPVTARSIASPTAWEVRGAGETLEYEPVMGPDGRTYDLNLVPQRVTLLGFRDEVGMANDASISQPIFSTQKLMTTTSAVNTPHYLGTFTSPSVREGEQGASKIWLAFLHAFPVTLPAVKAKELKNALAPSVHLEYSYFSADRMAARDVLLAADSLNGPWEKLQALLKDKKARFEHVTSVRTKSGQSAMAEEIQEIRFMTEYAPESLAATSTENTRRSTTTESKEQPPGKPAAAAPKAGANAGVTVTENITTIRTAADAERLPGYATAFEMNNAGFTTEVEPVIGPDGETIDLNFAIRSARHLGNLKVTGIAARYPAVPLFENIRVTASITVPDGRYVLAGTFNAPPANGVNDRADTGRAGLLFVRATLEEP